MVNAVNHIQNTPIRTATFGLQQTANAEGVRPGVFYALNQDALSPVNAPKATSIGMFNWLIHPFKSWQLSSKLARNPQSFETYGQRLAMFNAVEKNLSSKGKARLYDMLKSGELTDSQTDSRHSTLAHLYNIVTTPRGQGINGKAVLEDLVRLMSQPEAVNQKFGNLSSDMAQHLLQYYRSGFGPRIKENIDLNSLKVASSATCVSSAQLTYMLRHRKAELARQIDQATSPQLAFYKRVTAAELSPDDPANAVNVLKTYQIPAAEVVNSNGQEFLVKVNVPYSGLVRAVNQQNRGKVGERGVVESIYQAALTHLVVQSYDPGLDKRVNNDGSLDPSKGLEEDRKTLMETIIRGNGGVKSVTYQFTASDRNGDPYLMGYYRDFNRTTNDLITALNMKEDVIIGITDTDQTQTTGRINMGHELLVVGYQKDKNGDVIFKIADSDDEKPNYVYRKASEIVPKIHHAGFPVRLANTIQREMLAQINNNYLLPDQNDATRWELVSTLPTSRQKAFLQDYQAMLNEQEQPAAAPQQPQVAQQPQQPVYNNPVYQPSTYAPVYYNNAAYAPYAPAAVYPMPYAYNRPNWSRAA